MKSHTLFLSYGMFAARKVPEMYKFPEDNPSERVEGVIGG
jgi:hypothetical protein